MVTAPISDRAVSYVRTVLAACCCAALVFCGARSIHWPVIWDPSIMHYVNFLMAHGLAPYRDIIDINMPGCYFMDGWVMSVFGGGDLAWRIYEFCLLGAMIGAMVVIAWPYDWYAGLCAGTLFACTHITEGPRSAGQREELMTVLIVMGYACLFLAFRRRVPSLMILFGAALGLAASLKPTVALLVVLLPMMAAYTARREGLRQRAYLGWTAAGFLAAMLLDVRFFWHYRAFHDFLVLSRRLVTYYATIGNDTYKDLFGTFVNHRFLPLLALGALLLFANRKGSVERGVERNLLLVGVLFGAASYLAQRKNFEHHLYTLFALLLLVVCLEISVLWRATDLRRLAGVACFVLLTMPVLAKSSYLMLHTPRLEAMQETLQVDLSHLGSPAELQHEILCFDVVQSCYSVLYRMQVLPYSNLVADYMLFPPHGYQPISYYRDILWQQLQQKKPRIVVATNFWLAMSPSFDKLKEWPAVVAFLQANYDVVRVFQSGGDAYRIYVRKPDVKATPDGRDANRS